MSLPFRAPQDCVQYYTGKSGVFKSYNFVNGRLQQSLNMAICFRQELGMKCQPHIFFGMQHQLLGYCAVNYGTDTGQTDPDNFQLNTIPAATTAAEVS